MEERNYPEIGSVLYKKNNKARSYRIKVNSREEIHVTIPLFGTIKQAEKFVLSKKNWIINSKSRLSKKTVYLYGLKQYNDKVSLNIISQNEQKNIISFKVENMTEMTITFPEHIDINKTSSQEQIRKCLDKLLSVVANNYLLDRIREISLEVKLEYNSVKITSAKTRWGSCSGKNNINLSKYLVMLPENLIDYVIIHELCHTVHKNHSKEFHKLVDYYCLGQEKNLIKELKEYHIL
jgi:predicted metal-dependent hydrolase